MAAYTAVDDPEAHFQVAQYSGNGSANNAITLPGDTNMQPDFVWIKNQDATDGHCWFDAVRGATKVIDSQNDNAETTDADTLDSFATDGFQVDADVKVNTSGEDYSAWCWKGNGSGSSNTDGTINTAGTSANTTTGFSINTYTGTGANATVGHGLGTIPHAILVKKTNASGHWNLYHHTTGNGKTNYFNLTQAVSTDSARWNDTTPTSSVFSLGSETNVNGDGDTHVAYCFANKQGFFKAGGYTGNGDSTDGTFINTGFRPALVIIKRTDTANDWAMVDRLRLGHNASSHGNYIFYANTNSTSFASDWVDMYSNGFRLEDQDAHVNATGGSYIYLAWAHSPFVNSNGVPNNAR